jgi:hypothetical protein
LKIKLPQRDMEDVLAWAPEKSGVFSVRSAYKLAKEEAERPRTTTASRAPDGTRAIWKALWRCPAPPKVRVFAWKLITNSLATWENKYHRNIETTDTCVLCGMESETTFHAFCRCPMARNLWNAMAEIWRLPKVDELVNNGSEWLLHLLDQCSEIEGTMLLMTLWRIWHVRNEVVHHKSAPRIDASKRFLSSYLGSLLCIKQHPQSDITKGKMVVDYGRTNAREKDAVQASVRLLPSRFWSKPPDGIIKLNVDGSFSASEGNGGAGMVIRDHNGDIKLSACRHLVSCSSPLKQS